MRTVLKILGTPSAQTLEKLAEMYPACDLSFAERRLQCAVAHDKRQRCAVDFVLELDPDAQS